MNRATPQMRHFAKRLITLETTGVGALRSKDADGFPVPEKLRPILAMLMGNAGFRTLFARALTLATAENPALRAVHVTEEGTLDGWEELSARIGPSGFLECRIVLLAQLLGLLVAFIGEKLTVRLVMEVWPKLSLNDLNLDKGEKNEKAH